MRLLTGPGPLRTVGRAFLYLSMCIYLSICLAIYPPGGLRALRFSRAERDIFIFSLAGLCLSVISRSLVDDPEGFSAV